jgi:hypothetical protein
VGSWKRSLRLPRQLPTLLQVSPGCPGSPLARLSSCLAWRWPLRNWSVGPCPSNGSAVPLSGHLATVGDLVALAGAPATPTISRLLEPGSWKIRANERVRVSKIRSLEFIAVLVAASETVRLRQAVGRPSRRDSLACSSVKPNAKIS